MAQPAANLPQFSTKAPSLTVNRFKVRVAIDFGTDGIGMIILIVFEITIQHYLETSYSISICIW